MQIIEYGDANTQKVWYLETSDKVLDSRVWQGTTRVAIWYLEKRWVNTGVQMISPLVNQNCH